jgi:hypothetical protein
MHLLPGVAMQPNFELKTRPGNTKGGSITVPLTSCLTGLESAVWQLTIFVFICKTDFYFQMPISLMLAVACIIKIF